MWIAQALELDISSCGGSKEKALRNLHEAVRLFLEESEKMAVLAGESGFLLIPNVAKTWAPRGQTPVHRHCCRRDKISVIAGVSVSPKRQRLGLFCQLYFNNIGQEEVRGPVHELTRRTAGATPAQASPPSYPALPSSAPELNPDEVWSLAKRDLANGCAHDVEELTGIENIRNSPGIIPRYASVPVFIIKNNRRTGVISR